MGGGTRLGAEGVVGVTVGQEPGAGEGWAPGPLPVVLLFLLRASLGPATPPTPSRASGMEMSIRKVGPGMWEKGFRPTVARVEKIAEGQIHRGRRNEGSQDTY